MRFDKDSIQNLLKKWARKIIERIRNASLINRITGGLFALSLFLLLVVPSYSKLLFLYVAAFASLLWMASLLFHSARRLHSEKLPGKNPFTIQLIAALLAFVLLLTIGNTTPTYDKSQEPMNRMIAKLTGTIALPQEEAVKELKLMSEYFKAHSLFNYNVLMLSADNRVLHDHTGWLTGGAKTVYPIYSHSPYDAVGMMVLLNGNEQVLGAFEIDRGHGYNTDISLPNYSLTLAPDAAGSEGMPDILEQLHDRYFPSFGAVIDEYALQLAVDVDRMTVETDTPYTGEFANRPYDYDYQMDFLTWNGEKIIDLHSVHQRGSMKYSGQNLIDALNALNAEERQALQTHVRWLKSAWKSIHLDWGQSIQVFENANGSYKILLIYNANPYVLYPLQTEASDIRYHRRLLVYIAMMFVLPLCWLLLALWVFADAKRRGHERPALWGVLTMIGSVITLIIYHMVRPKMRTDKEGRKQPKGLCPLCGAVLKDDYIACPGCGVPIRCTCPSCGHALENDWNFCPYCSRQIVRPAIEGEVEAEIVNSEAAAEAAAASAENERSNASEEAISKDDSDTENASEA